jgi:hypothetical protein
LGLATTHTYIDIISWVYRSCDWVNQPGSQPLLLPLFSYLPSFSI